MIFFLDIIYKILFIIYFSITNIFFDANIPPSFLLPLCRGRLGRGNTKNPSFLRGFLLLIEYSTF